MDEKEKYFLEKEKIGSNYIYNGKDYDFELTDKTDIKRLARYIEVKGINNKRHQFGLSKKEYEFALKHKNDHMTYLIENFNNKKERISYKLKTKNFLDKPITYAFVKPKDY